MSALAHVLAERGQTVRGADPGISGKTKARLEAAGATVYTTHDAANVGDASAVVVSDAIPENNPEVQDAKRRGLPIIRRPEILGAIVNSGRGIAISGTHGKTTTTGMTASVLLAANLDPSLFIGGDLPAIGGNARNGRGDVVLAEACEAYDGFLYLHPEIAVVLNTEPDHLDYHGSEDHVTASFERFVAQVKDGGSAILNADDEGAAALYASAVAFRDEIDAVSYSAEGSKNADIRAEQILLTGAETSFTLTEWGQEVGRVRLQVPGRHNISNALAAAAVGFALNIPNEHIIKGLEAFTGTGRRFEKIGEKNGVLVYDDYAHHPTEIAATLDAARNAFPDRRLIAVFQPHLPSRTRDFLDAFADALSMADVLFLTDIYLAREQPIEGVSSSILAGKVQASAPVLNVQYVPSKADLPAALRAVSALRRPRSDNGRGRYSSGGGRTFPNFMSDTTKKKIAVLRGGRSAERQVSLATGSKSPNR
jgi:UDP-N-acetylmuramate--alanine ligase